MPEMTKDAKDKLKKIMRDYMVEYYKSEVAYFKQVKGLLDHINEKQNLIELKKIIDTKLNK